jgi:hypothetical protein
VTGAGWRRPKWNQPDQLTLWLHRASASPAGSTHSLASNGNQPDQLTVWLNRASTSPAGSTHSLASNGNQPDQLTLWLHRASLNSTPHRASLSEQQQSSKQRHRQPTSTTSRPAIAINRRRVTPRAPLQASHNASCVITVRVNKSAYHLQPIINCGYNAQHCCFKRTSFFTSQSFSALKMDATHFSDIGTCLSYYTASHPRRP